MSDLNRYKVSVPEGRSGDWAVERFDVTEQDAAFSRIRAVVNPREAGREIKVGRYTKLTHDGHVVMSDVPAEIYDHLGFIGMASGRVLIHGLGLGVALQGALEKPAVRHVKVIEKSPDVIRLVAPHYQERYGERVEIVEGDAFEWKPQKGERWDVAWHDVWNAICGDNWESIKRLHRKFARRTTWQGSWARVETMAAAKGWR
jgi:hypothetical protein